SFIETMEHLVFALDAWFVQTVFEDDERYEQVVASMGDLRIPVGTDGNRTRESAGPGGHGERTAESDRLSLDEVLGERAARHEVMRAFVADVTPEEFGRVVESSRSPHAHYILKNYATRKVG